MGMHVRDRTSRRGGRHGRMSVDPDRGRRDRGDRGRRIPGGDPATPKAAPEGVRPEYQRAVAERGDVRLGESDLMARRDHRRTLDIRPLRPESRDNYRRSWDRLQARFVDDPAGVLGQADGLIIAVMGERGYPMDAFDQRADDISVDRP